MGEQERGALRLNGEVVAVERRAVDLDPVRGQRVPQHGDKEPRRIVHRERAPNGRAAGRHHTPQLDPVATGQAPRLDRRRSRADGLQMVVNDEPAAVRIDADDGVVAGCGAGRDRRADGVFVELQRADAGRVAFAQVVPGPSGSEPLVVERAVVADDPPLDAAKAERLQLLGPTVEDARGRAVAAADARVAGADDDQIAAERAALDRAGGEQPRLVAVIPPEAIGGGGQRDDFHVRRRHQQLAGVLAVERFVGGERFDEHAPEAVLERGRGEDGVEIVLKLADRREARGCGGPRRRVAGRERDGCQDGRERGAGSEAREAELAPRPTWTIHRGP